MRVRVVAAVGLFVAAALTVAGCGGGESAPVAPAAAANAVPSEGPPDAPAGPVSAGADHAPPGVSPQLDTRTVANAAKVVGVPAPSSDAVAAYVAELDAIDPAIVAGRPTAMSLMVNGLGTCRALAANRDPQHLLVETMLSFGNEQIELTREQGTRVVDAIRRTLCAG